MGRTGDLRELLAAPAYGWWEPLNIPPRGDPPPFSLQAMEIKHPFVPTDDRRRRCPRTIHP